MVETSGYDPELWFVAEADGAVAGISLCRMQDSGDPRHGWVSILGVLPAFRRRGLGAALLRHTFAVFAARGCTRVSLGVDAESTTGAVRLYERVGMRQVRRADTWEKAL
jgi:ribosomal protein S18 acetylase RimI-like enzyme